MVCGDLTKIYKIVYTSYRMLQMMTSQSENCTLCSKGVQADGFAAQRESVKDDTTKVVIQVDFAENFTTKTQIEIQSAYWAYNQVTLFTACAWEQGGTHPMVIVSDYLQHRKFALNVFLQFIMQHL